MNLRDAAAAIGIVAVSIGLFAPETHAQAGFACSLGPGMPSYMPQVDMVAEAKWSTLSTSVYKALCPTGCGSISLVANQTAPNAVTFAAKGFPSKVAYSPAFFTQLNNALGSPAVFGVLAHEMGHHIDINIAPPAWLLSSWGRELRADAWAGCALAKAGYGTKETEAALRAIAQYPSPSHPAWNLRIPALKEGYTRCGGSSFPTAVTPTVPAPAATAPASTAPAPSTPTNPPAAIKPDPCKCIKKFNRCIGHVTTMDECLDDRVEKCIDSCTDKWGYPYLKCANELCRRDSPTNIQAWTPLCNKRIKSEKDRCTSDKETCEDACEP